MKDSTKRKPGTSQKQLKKKCKSEEKKIKGKQRYICEKCGKSYASNSGLAYHKMTHSDQRPFGCSYCKKAFRTSTSLKIHQLGHLDTPDGFICHICDKGFKRRNSYEYHKWKAHRSDPKSGAKKGLTCEKCNKEFFNKKDLALHSKTHYKSYICNFCKKIFNNYQELVADKRKHRRNREYSCDVCDYSTNRYSELTFHKQIHSDKPKPHQCGVCGKGFWKSNGLKVHMRKHTGERPYMCQKCGATYPYRFSLAAHMDSKHPSSSKVESNMRYECKDCNKTYKTRRALKEHEKIHSENTERLHKCGYCGKLFVNQSKLKTHLRVHTNERPYKCSCCTDAFKESNSLKRHLKSRHGVDKFSKNQVTVQHKENKDSGYMDDGGDEVEHEQSNDEEENKADINLTETQRNSLLVEYEYVDSRSGNTCVDNINVILNPNTFQGETLEYTTDIRENLYSVEANVQTFNSEVPLFIDEYNTDTQLNVSQGIDAPLEFSDNNNTQTVLNTPLDEEFSFDRPQAEGNIYKTELAIDASENINCDSQGESPLNLILQNDSGENVENVDKEVTTSKHISKENHEDEKQYLEIPESNIEMEVCEYVESGESNSSILAETNEENSRQLETAETNQEINPKSEICLQESKNNITVSNDKKPKKIYKCDKCSKSYNKLQCFRDHQNIHAGKLGKFHHCELCEKFFPSASKLREHMSVHTGARPEICQVCHKSYKCRRSLRRHMIEHNTDKPKTKDKSPKVKKYECDQCEKFYASQQNLNIHKQSHGNIKDYVCEVCGKTFLTLEYLKTHAISHTDGKPFKCEQENCERSFKWMISLKAHMKTHAAVRGHQCPECPQAFYTKGELTVHSKIHTTVRNFTCDICKKSYKTKRVLHLHKTRCHRKPMEPHIASTPVKPFSCTECRSTFFKEESLNIHKQNHKARDTGTSKDWVCRWVFHIILASVMFKEISAKARIN